MFRIHSYNYIPYWTKNYFKVIIHFVQIRNKVFLTATDSVFGRLVTFININFKKLKAKFCTKNEQLNAIFQIMCLILKLAGNIGPKWAARGGRWISAIQTLI
jgi:hypothetical protein